MRLIIAEKPSLARAIAEVLPQPHTKRGDYIECGGGTIVAWCAGHILEQAPPDHYDERFKQWDLSHLPIAPKEWKMAVSTPELFKTIKALLPKAERVVHAGDPDREGQLLVDEVLVFLGYRGPVDRLLISDLNPPAVRKALAELQPNSRFQRLYEAALARQRADWLYGLNMTRLYTLLGQAGGYSGVLSVGRVQTPLLGLVVRRDLEIEGFQPKPYFVVRARVSAGGVDTEFRAAWRPGPTDDGFLDVEGRLVSAERAARIERTTAGQTGTITTGTVERKTESAPLPYSLADLQVDAAKRLGLSAKDVLDVCQSLYEHHRLTTYPRSDCAYLPEGHFAQAAAVVSAIVKTAPDMVPFARLADLQRRSRAWNDSKVTAHHGIIPTTSSKDIAELSEREGAIYELIARRYLMQFFPAFEYNQAQLEATIVGERFGASGRQPLIPGWRALVAAQGDEAEEDKTDDEAKSAVLLPLLELGQAVSAVEVSTIERKTRPPKRFTDDTLLQAMSGIARFVSDPRIKQILRETDGIGTPATQAQIIETLFHRKFLERNGRQIVSTGTGRALVQALPAVSTTPDMTALWEAAIRAIHDGERPLDGFLTAVLRQLEQLITQGKALRSLTLPGARPCPREGCGGFLRLRKGASGSFWGCAKYPACSATAPDANASPSTRGRRSGPRKRRRSAA